MKLVDKINNSGLFATSSYSAGVATNDSLNRSITGTYIPNLTSALGQTISESLVELDNRLSEVEEVHSTDIASLGEQIYQTNKDLVNLKLRANGTTIPYSATISTNYIGWNLVPTGGNISISTGTSGRIIFSAKPYTSLASVNSAQYNNLTSVSATVKNYSAGWTNSAHSGYAASAWITNHSGDIAIFPMTGYNDVFAYTANMNCSSIKLEQSASVLGISTSSSVRFNPTNIVYEVTGSSYSAYWDKVINKANEPSLTAYSANTASLFSGTSRSATVANTCFTAQYANESTNATNSTYSQIADYAKSLRNRVLQTSLTK